ncbi:hypothetical protein ACTHEF_004132 [Vibrio parahaemolyticus]
MNNSISSSDLISYIVELEQFETTSLEDQVIEKAFESGFITKDENSENLHKKAWIKRVTHLVGDSFKLDAIVEGETPELTMANFKQFKKNRETQVNDVLKLLARLLVDSVPPYPYRG